MIGDRINTRSAQSKLHEQGLVGHLIELRNRLLRTLTVVAIIFIPLAPFANDLYAFIAEPLLNLMPEGTTMIATEVAAPFWIPFKFTMVLAIFLAIPAVLYQLWSFIAPGLYPHERRMMLPLLVASSVLFYLGAIFAYYIVFPLMFGFFIGIAPEGVAVMTDISSYLDFVLKLFFAFGLAFEVPIITIVLVWARITTPEKLVEKRAYIIVGAFVLGMLFTPPDMISQTLLAIPMWILFELGVIFSRLVVKHRKEPPDEGAEGP